MVVLTDWLDWLRASTFTVNVADTTAPVVGAVASQTIEATSAAGAAHSWVVPTATDVVDGDRRVRRGDLVVVDFGVLIAVQHELVVRERFDVQNFVVRVEVHEPHRQHTLVRGRQKLAQSFNGHKPTKQPKGSIFDKVKDIFG